MIYLRHILAGILQGATELLPVASGGILSFFRSVWPAEGGLLAESALLHAGTALALILLLRKELAGVFREWFFLLEEIMENTLIFLRNSRKAGEYEYFPLMQTNMRKFSALLLLTMIPAGLAGYFLYPAAAGFAESPLVSAMGCFISAILLLVAALSPARSTRPREIPLLLALPVGLLAGMCVRPGFSCLSVTVASATGSCVAGNSASGSPLANTVTILETSSAMMHSAESSFLHRFIMLPTPFFRRPGKCYFRIHFRAFNPVPLHKSYIWVVFHVSTCLILGILSHSNHTTEIYDLQPF